MDSKIIWIVIACLAAAVTVLVVIRVRRVVLNAVMGLRTLKKVLEKQSDMLEETPKSVAGMTRVFLPQIQRDFPEFHLNEFRQRAENMLRAALTAIDTRRIEAMKDPSDDLRQQILLKIEDLNRRKEREHFNGIEIHQTEIARYLKEKGTCVIQLQSAVGYYHYVQAEDGRILSGSKERKIQTKYEVELVYIQDAAQLKEGAKTTGLTCPNCGAPVTNLGSKFCEYCKTGLREVNIRVWVINRIREML